MSDTPEFEPFIWAGQKRYRCNQLWESGGKCDFDTYDLELMQAHIREPHTRSGKHNPTSAPARVSPILDAEGKNIVVHRDGKGNETYRFKK